MKPKRTVPPFVGPVLIVAVLVVLGVMLWNAFDLGTHFAVRRAVADLLDRNRIEEARRTLLDANDRRLAIGTLRDALESEEGSVQGKAEVLRALDVFRETGAIRDAIDSEVASTRRAAASYLRDDDRLADRIREITLAWLRDGDASDRGLAARICSRLEIREAIPDLMAMIRGPIETARDEEAAVAALSALDALGAPEMVDRALELAGDDDTPEQVRAASFYALSHADDLPVGRARDLALQVLQDRTQSNIVRSTATNILNRGSVADERVWDVLESVLVDRSEPEQVVKRICLSTLGSTAPLDRIRRVVLRPEVYGHDYFGVRIDVATGLAALAVREPIAYDILLDYLVDDDPLDTQHLVRKEGWLTLWSLTGVMYGLDETELFSAEPAQLEDPGKIRAHLFSRGWLRPNVTEDMWKAVDAAGGDLATMKRVRTTYESLKGRIVDAWNEREGG